MGADFSSYLIFGMPVSEEDFWHAAGSKVICSSGHEQPSPDMQFCPKCGKKFEDAEFVAPTPALEKYAIELGIEDHDEAWERLQEDDGEGFCILCADPSQGSESTRESLVLGVRLMNVDEYTRDPFPIPWEGLKAERENIRKAVETMGLEWKEPILTTVLYCSC